MANVVVTGAGSGIGAATAGLLSARGWRVFGTFRTLPPELPDRVEPIVADLRDRASIHAGIAAILHALAGEPLHGLVNNAGVAEPGPASEQPLDDFTDHLQVNVIAVHQITRSLLPALGLGAAGGGRIVNISSVSGRVALPFTTAYSASKFALEGYSQALRRELFGTGIDVVVVAPGMVRTPIWSKAAEAQTRYASSSFARPLKRLIEEMSRQAERAHSPEKIAGIIAAALEQARPPARRAVVANRFQNEIAPRALPQRLVDRVIARQLGLGPRR